MNTGFILYDVYANIKQWFRNRSAVFWTLLFPILLILIFGSIFFNTNDITYDIIVRDLDNSSFSEILIGILENISVLNIQQVEEDENISMLMIKNDVAAAVIIPPGFGSKMSESLVNPSISTNISLYYDPSRRETVDVIRTILQSTLYEFNLRLTGGRSIVGLDENIIASEEFNYIDFFVPGMIGFTIMTSCIYGSIERNTKYRKNGILRKLLTMPISKAEWFLAKMLFMLFLSFLSTLVIILVGVAAFNLHVYPGILAIVIIISSSFLFTGIGMLIARFVRDEETADMAGGAVTFPMMFLAGTFFPLDIMPGFLQVAARFLPLYYVNEGLRNAMIYDNVEKAVYFTSFVVLFSLFFFILGVFLTKWSED
ncbi:MAG TPA: ABC transporter permease [Thermoplasmatales archaeon]|nr:ABC transporter permease [Thermoplasmatales archaeon]